MADDDARSRSHWWRFLRRHPYGTALAFVLAFLSFWVPDLLCLLRGWHPLRILLMAGVLAAGLRLVYLWYRRQNISSSPEPNEDRPQFFQLFDWCVITFVGAGMLLGGSWWIWGSLFELNVPAARATAALSTVAGLGGAVFLVVKYRTQALSERQEKRDEERLKYEKHRLQHEIDKTEQENLEARFAEAITMLRDPRTWSRIAGVYALASVADAKGGLPYKQRVVDILCGYLRTDRLEKDAEGNTRYHLSEDGTPDTSRPISHDRAVESEIIQVMAAHLRAADPHDLEKGSADGSLSGDQLWRACNFDLHEAKIAERANFSGCTFAGTITLTDAEFYHYVNFSRTHFLATTLINATIFHRETHIKKAMFLGKTRLRCMHFHDKADFSETSFFTEQDLDSSTFRGAADFSKCIFHKEANFRGVEFHDAAAFKSTIFHGATYFWASTFAGRVDFMEAEFLDDAQFNDSDMAARHALKESPCTFRGYTLFSDAKFHKGASFHATFEGHAVFCGTCFGDHVSFSKSRFSSETDFHSATFSGGARFANTEFSEQPSFAEAIFDRPPEFDAAVKLDPKTKLPPGAKWADEVDEDPPGESA